MRARDRFCLWSLCAACALPAARALADEPPGAAPALPTAHPATADDAAEAARLTRQFGLQLQIQERGPKEPWRLVIKNRGVAPVTLVSDVRLLFFEVEVPGEKEPTLCILPEGMRAAGQAQLLHVALHPGEVLVRRFDPRFYCFEEGDQNVLVPGALLKPRYGWPSETKVSWKQGKRVTEVLPPSPPFVVVPGVEEIQANRPPPTPDDDSEHRSSIAEQGPLGEAALSNPTGGNTSPSKSAPAVVGVRNLEGRPLALGSEYALWSASGLVGDEKSPLRLRVTRGSDAETERGVTVTVSMINQTKSSMRLFFRRELLGFDVWGPGGSATCQLESESREPERQAFLALAPGEEMTITSRLVELCPRGSFFLPGMYLVNARLSASDGGERFGLNAFVGNVSSVVPKPVRVRKRDEPFLTPAPLRVPTGSPAPAAPPAPTPAPAPAPAPAPVPPS